MMSVPSFIELFSGFIHELVQLIQIDICEYGRNDAALRTAGVGGADIASPPYIRL